jgi:hypothetical protein
MTRSGSLSTPTRRRRLWLLACAAALLAPSVPALHSVLLQPATASSAGLPAGVSYEVVRRGSSVAYVARVALPSPSSAIGVLAQDRLLGLETTSSMASRRHAVVAVNGDFALRDGRPVHPYGDYLRLWQGHPGLGGGVGLADHTAFVGWPQSRSALTAHGGPHFQIARWNYGPPGGAEIVGFDRAGAGLEGPPHGFCHVALEPRGNVPATSGWVETEFVVTGQQCGSAPGISFDGVVLSAVPGTIAAGDLGRLTRGRSVVLSQRIGFDGSLHVVGGSEVLVAGGHVHAPDIDRSGSYVRGRHPRTAVGRTHDGDLMLVVVDGRQPGYSVGMSLRELAHLMRDLGAHDAVNLDGGGSSTMYVNGRVVNRPSDGSERPVSSAIAVVRDPEPKQPPPPPPPSKPSPLPLPLDLPVQWQRTATDPGSTGGLADALARDGVPLSPVLQEAAALFAEAHG